MFEVGNTTWVRMLQRVYEFHNACRVCSLRMVKWCLCGLSGGGAGGYQLVTPAYYDQSGQLVMGNSRALPQMVRLMSPATLLMNSPAGQQSKTFICFE